MSDHHDVNLANLPYDIVRRIIRMGRDHSIDDMKLITNTWYDLALEHLSDKRLLPVIEDFFWPCYHSQATVKIQISESRRLPYFGVVNWKTRDSTRHPAGTLYHREFEFAEESYGQELMDRICSRIFNRCSRILRFELNITMTFGEIETTLEPIKKVLDTGIIKKLVIKGITSFAKDKISPLLRDLRTCSLPCLELDFFGCIIFDKYKDEFRWFLQEAVLGVDTVEMTGIQWPDNVSTDWYEWARDLSKDTNIKIRVNMEKLEWSTSEVLMGVRFAVTGDKDEQ